MAVAGLAILGYIGWEFYGTTWVSHRHQHAVVADLRREWAQAPTGTSGGGVVRTRWGRASAIVRIPRFGAGYAVPVLEGTGESQLAAGFGHFAGTAGPGQVGNYALAGHRITHGEPLRDMPDLRPGDRVIVQTRTATYTYRLVTAGDALDVPLTATWVLDPLPHNPVTGGVEPPQRPGERLLTLATCAELFHTDDRYVAFGVLTRTLRNAT